MVLPRKMCILEGEDGGRAMNCGVVSKHLILRKLRRRASEAASVAGGMGLIESEHLVYSPVPDSAHMDTESTLHREGRPSGQHPEQATNGRK